MSSLIESAKAVYCLNTSDSRHKLFTINIKSLQSLIKNGTLKIYEKQRCLNEDRVKKLVAWQTSYFKSCGHIKIRGNIVICKVSDPLLHLNGKTSTAYIIDGQHRFECYRRLIEYGLVDDINILVEWIEVGCVNEIETEFKEINSGVPVPQHYIHPNEVVDRCVDILISYYPKAFVETNKPKRPQMCIDTFKDTLIANYKEINDTHKINSGEELSNLIKKVDAEYKEKGLQYMCDIIAKQNKSQRSIISNGFTKCESNPPKYMFIGLFKNIDDWIEELIN